MSIVSALSVCCDGWLRLKCFTCSMSYLADQHHNCRGFGKQSNYEDYQDNQLSHGTEGTWTSGQFSQGAEGPWTSGEFMSVFLFLEVTVVSAVFLAAVSSVTSVCAYPLCSVPRKCSV